MLNFEFLSPTKIIFGKGTISTVGDEVRRHSNKVLLHYGKESLKKSGLYDIIIKSLKENGIEYIELSGVKPNPDIELVYEGIKICRENNIDFILAAGGGSVIDSAKAISIGMHYKGDVWDFYTGNAAPKRATKTGVILTIPASGSEASKSSVISNTKSGQKRGANFDITRPVFAVMDPEITYSLPAYQTACGACDMLAHVIERYFTNVKNVELTDRLCEAVMKTIINNSLIVIKEPSNYNARAELMWAGTLAHNDLLSTGRVGDFASHAIDHELSAFNDVAHGAGLAVLLPAWMQYVYKHDIDRFVQFALRVWDVEENQAEPEEAALEGIKRFKEYLKEIGMPLTLCDININQKYIPMLAEKCRKSEDGTTGNFVKLKQEDIENILKLSAV